MASHDPMASTSDGHDSSHNDNTIPIASNSKTSLMSAGPMPFGSLFPTMNFNGDSNLLVGDQCKEALKVLSIDELAERFGPECSTSSNFRNHISKQPNIRMRKESFQSQRARRHALVPYVCKIPKERKLRMAASVANTELLKRLLLEGTSPDTFDDHKRTALHLAASRGLFIAISFCFLNSIEPSFLFVMIACQSITISFKGYRDMVKILLIYRADPNKQDVLGNTPLHLAVCSASSYNFNMVRKMEKRKYFIRNGDMIHFRMSFCLVCVSGGANFIGAWCPC